MSNEPTPPGNKLVSIVCRSVGRTELKQALASVFEQSYRPLEIILVQATPTPLDDFIEFAGNLPVHLIKSAQPLARAAAANAGLDAVSGSYVMFLDDDDWIGASHVEDLVNVLESESAVRAAYSNTQKMSADGKQGKEIFQQDYDPAYLMHDNYIPIHSMLFSSELLALGCRFDESFEIFEDWDFWLQVNQHTDFHHLPTLGAFYREGGDSETKSADDSDRYRSDNPRGKSRALVFEKWMKIWDGDKLNQLLGAMDSSEKILELSAAIKVLQSNLQDSNSHNGQLLSQSQEMGEQIATLQQDLERKAKDNAQLNEKAELQATRIRSQSEELEIANEELEIANKDIKNLSQTLATEVNHRVETNEKLEDTLKTLQQQSEHLENTLETLRHRHEQLESLQNHAAALDKALRTILDSTSWKVMGPYRKVGRFVKRLLGLGSSAPDMHSTPPPIETSDHDEVGSVSALSTEPKSEVEPPQTHPLCFYIDRGFVFNDCIFIRGWAIKAPGIEKISATVNEEKIPASIGAPRKDIQQAYPLVANAENSGFVLFGQVEKFGTVYLEFTDSEGEVTRKKVSLEHLNGPEPLIDSQEFVGLDPQTQYKVYSALERLRNPADEKLSAPFEYQPLVSIIVPVYNVEKRWLDKCIDSVIKQTYSRWQLCLHDDASTDQATLDCLQNWSSKDDRIKVQYGSTNQHISGASNSALEIATGEFIGLMDNDDELHKDALWCVVEALNKDRDLDYIYTDEDKINEDGEYCEPHFKPGWSPELLESMMYVGHFGVIRRSVIDAVGGFRTGVEGSQDYDLTLRISQRTQRFGHIPRVLYHWRIIPGSVAGGDGAKSYAYDAAVKALSNHIKDDPIPGTVSTTQFLGRYRIRRDAGDPSITIILPFHNKAEMTIDCLRSIELSTYDNFEILLISNNSEESEFDKVDAYAKTVDRIRLVKLDIPFNWSAINNWGIENSASEFVLMLNNDMTVISKDWMESLLDYAVKNDVGAVGAKLLYEDDTIQHAGIIMQLGGIASHAFKHIANDDPGYFGYATSVRNCSAVTGACMLVRRSIALEIGGFNEELRVAYNDVDFCLRLREANYKVVYTPFAQLYHLESKTRPKFLDDMNSAQLAEFEKESAYIKKRHSKYFLEGDPYYNRALSLRVENYSLRV